ncbi:hypothetical protein Tco_1119972 [Tanacetum coccineum]
MATIFFTASSSRQDKSPPPTSFLFDAGNDLGLEQIPSSKGDDITATSVSTKRRQNEEAHDGGNIKEVEKRNMDIDESENFVLSRRTCGEKDGGHGTKDMRKKDSDDGDENRDAEIDSSKNDEDLWEPMQWRSSSKLNDGEDSKEKIHSGGDQSDEKDYNKLINAEENDADDDQSDKDSDEESKSSGNTNGIQKEYGVGVV